MKLGQRRPDLELLRAMADRLGQSARELITGMSAESGEAVELTLTLAEIGLESGDAAGSLELLEGLLGAEGPRPAGGALVEARYLRARALEATGDHRGAIVELEQVAGVEGGARWLTSLIALARCYREIGDFNRSIEVGDRVRNRLKELGLEASDEAFQLEVTVAYSHFARGDIAQAIRLSRQTIAHAEKVGSPTARAAAYWNASIYESKRGAGAAAITLAQRALALLGEGSDTRNLARLRAQLGQMLLGVDPPELEEAEVQLERASQDLRATSASVIDIARCDLDVARVRLLKGDNDAAFDLAEAARVTAHPDAPLLEAGALTVLGRIVGQGGDVARAAELYRSAVLVLTSVGADQEAAQSWLELGTLLDAVGDIEAAKMAYRSAAVASGLQIPRGLHTHI